MSAPATTNLPGHDIDQVVDAVLRRLRGEQVVRAAQAPANTTSDTATLRLDARVVTLESLPRSLNGVSEVIARTGAILTPAARDRLVEACIRVTFESIAAAKIRAPGELPLALAMPWNAGPLVADLARRGVACGVRTYTSDAAAVRALLAASTDDSPGVLLTDEPQIACCLANRDPRVRAATAVSLPELDGLLAKLGLNLLVLRPIGQSVPMLARLIERFASAGPRTCPDALSTSPMNGGLPCKSPA